MKRNKDLSENVNYQLCIQANHDNDKAYMSGTVQPDRTQHFEMEFTADVDEANCALVLEFKESGTVKGEHLSLVVLSADTCRTKESVCRLYEAMYPDLIQEKSEPLVSRGSLSYNYCFGLI